MNMKYAVLMCTLLLQGVLACKELRWNWNTLDTRNISFPEHFEFCAATSEYQLSGGACFYEGEKRKDCPDSNWLRYEKQMTLFGNHFIDSSGRGIDHWNRYEEDIELVKQLGVSVYRCSIAWERVQPHKGYFDEEVINHYHALFDKARREGLELMVTLHHFVNPGWFDDDGGFEKEENISFFVEFAKRMFTEFREKVSWWCTINEPGVYAAQTYFIHDFPRPQQSDLGFPCNIGRGMCMYGVALVTKHLIMAHGATYKALKELPGGDQAQIGLVHQIVQFESYHPGNRFEIMVTDILNRVFHSAITEFLLTGNLAFTTYTDTVTYSASVFQDFLGINYYSNVLFNWAYPTAPQFRPEDESIVTDMYYGIYAEGMYRVLKELSRTGKPIYITENGIADAYDDRRELWYKRYLYAVGKALEEGVDVRMFCAWSAFDNFEWNLGYDKKFGLIKVDMKTYERMFRAGAEYFREVAHKQAGIPYKQMAPQPACVKETVALSERDQSNKSEL